MLITSVNNDKVKYLVKLKEKKFRDNEKVFLIEGDHLVNIALEQNKVLELFCLEGTNYNFENITYVSDIVMKKISSQVSISNVVAVVKYDYKNEIIGNTLLIDSLQDPGNLGTIIRSAVAFDFKTIVLGDNTVDVYNDKTIRASEGMLFNINLVKQNLFDTIDKLHEKHYTVIASDVRDGASLIPKENVAIIIGNEGNGVNPKLEEKCDMLVNIKMNSACESLNAGVAASILMYEVFHD